MSRGEGNRELRKADVFYLERLSGETERSSQICNVCALLETSTKFGILVNMVATITIGYRTTSAAPPGGWSRHPLNVGTCCHINVYNFGSRRNFFILFSELYSEDVH